MNKDIFIIIPCYNEAKVVSSAITPLIDMGYSVVFVDDGSTDGSLESVQHLPIHTIRHPINLGQGASIMTGTKYALKQGAKVVIHFDADGQHPSESIKDILKPITSGEAEVVLGSRFLGPQAGEGVPWLKQLVLKTGRWFTYMTTGIKLTDTNNGFRALTAHAAQKIEITENRMAHASEIVSLINQHQLSYKEIPCRINYTDYSMAKGQSIFNAVNIVIDLALRKLTK